MDIYSIIENSASFDLFTVQPTKLARAGNDHGAVDGYPQDMFIDYYNTYTPGDLIICKISLINWTQKKHRTHRNLSQDADPAYKWKKTADLFDKDKAFYEVVPGGRKAMPPMEIPSPDDHRRFSWSDSDYPELRTIQTFCLETQQQELQGWDA